MFHRRGSQDGRSANVHVGGLVGPHDSGSRTPRAVDGNDRRSTTTSGPAHTFEVVRSKLLTISICLALTVAACDSGGEDLSPSDAVATNEVSIFDNSFDPAVIEVAAGDSVTWTWEGNAPHDVPDLDAGPLEQLTPASVRSWRWWARASPTTKSAMSYT